MQSDLDLRRRLIVRLYARYQAADQAWVVATRAAAAWLPEAPPGKLALIGNPGSRVRQLYERREDALLRLASARAKLEAARQRRAVRTVLLIRG